ncbi:hypothetical protein F4820DRAFT_430342 [Hypoxylon rubiginosum]|uniref:Uncharacterized protein n=1 Tax=Hypoxylon rubiginosum TaxID=110542 RepID=A0ACB9YSY5_9PEZI|nr:hypothetical protein F4820DRAFT_430342 [Hypoxylon rubiginosum]
MRRWCRKEEVLFKYVCSYAVALAGYPDSFFFFFRAAVPSPAKNWSSGLDRILLVSIMGVAWPAATAALYAACVGYLGGGGSTLEMRAELVSNIGVIVGVGASGQDGLTTWWEFTRPRGALDRNKVVLWQIVSLIAFEQRDATK